MAEWGTRAPPMQREGMAEWGYLSRVTLWECKYSPRLKPLCLADRHVGPYLYWARGAHVG